MTELTPEQRHAIIDREWSYEEALLAFKTYEELASVGSFVNRPPPFLIELATACLCSVPTIEKAALQKCCAAFLKHIQELTSKD